MRSKEPKIKNRALRSVSASEGASPARGRSLGGTYWYLNVGLRALRSRELIFVLVGIGILLRVRQYLSNRSLWIDESWLALNLIERPLSELTRPLDFNQAAPIGFLFIEGIAARVFGYSEYALRLFPLICGLLSIPAFVWLARRTVFPEAAPFAILLFVCADALIYYSSEVKPYQADVAVAVGLLAAGTLLAESPGLTRGRALLIAVGGLALITFSFPAVLVVAALAVTFAIRLAFKWRDQRNSATTLALLVWSLASVGIGIYGLTRGRHVRESFEVASGRFLGVTGSPLHVLNVIGTRITDAIGFPETPPFNQVLKFTLLCAVIGAIALARRNPTQLAMFALPFVLLLGASAAHVYPLSQRTALFLLPAVILLITEGIAQVVRWVPARAKIATALFLGVAVAAGPVTLAGARFVHPRTREEIKPVLEFVRDHWRPGDTLYVHYGAQYAFLYYEKCGCLRLTGPGGRDLWPVVPVQGSRKQYARAVQATSPAVVIGRYAGDDRTRSLADLQRLRGRRRVWFLYTHVRDSHERSFIERELVGYLDRIGTRVRAIDRPQAHGYLYELR